MTQTAKHTPKWIVDPDPDKPYAVIENTEHGLGVCEIGPRTRCNLSRARLIAAAPETAAECKRLKALNAELLAALKSVVAQTDELAAIAAGCQSAVGFSNAALVRDLRVARAAIAKAEGC